MYTRATLAFQDAELPFWPNVDCEIHRWSFVLSSLLECSFPVLIMSRPMDEEEPSLLLVVLDASSDFWTKREATRRRQDAVRIFSQSKSSH